MRQHHPLENPSLAPYGFAFPPRQRRLDYNPPNTFWVNEEKLIARLWDRHHRSNAPRPFPVQTIVHEILPSSAAANRFTHGDFTFDGLPYLTRDILVLSSTLYWFGSGVGRNFLEVPPHRGPGYHPEREFLIKLREMRMDVVAHVTHVCTNACERGCRYNFNDVLPRDRALVAGLMWWLGKKAGREFVAEFVRRKESAWELARERRRGQMELPPRLRRFVKHP